MFSGALFEGPLEHIVGLNSILGHAIPILGRHLNEGVCPRVCASALEKPLGTAWAESERRIRLRVGRATRANSRALLGLCFAALLLFICFRSGGLDC